MSKLCAITLREKSDLQSLETTIAKGLRVFYEVGRALAEIRDRKLYRAEHHTFEDYLEKRWGFGRSQGYQLIKATEVVDSLVNSLSAVADKLSILPENERQARPLAELEPNERIEAWRTAVESAGGNQPTSEQVEAAVDRFLGPDDDTDLDDLAPDEQRERVEASEKKIGRTAAREARKEHLAAAIRCFRKGRKWLLREGDDLAEEVALADKLIARLEGVE